MKKYCVAADLFIFFVFAHTFLTISFFSRYITGMHFAYTCSKRTLISLSISLSHTHTRAKKYVYGGRNKNFHLVCLSQFLLICKSAFVHLSVYPSVPCLDSFLQKFFSPFLNGPSVPPPQNLTKEATQKNSACGPLSVTQKER